MAVTPTTAPFDGPLDGRWVRDVPLHDRHDPYSDALGDLDDDDSRSCPDLEPPEPAWALDASAQVLRERLSAATTAPVDGDIAGLLDVLTPDGTGNHAPAGRGPAELGPAGLVDGIVTAQRVINHFQALQRQWIAALARPGVAVPLDDLVAACQHPGRRIPGALRPPDDLPPDLPLGDEGEPDLAPLLNHPGWIGPLADTAARLASAQVGCALHLAPITARIRTESALALIDSLPATHGAQRAGDLDGYRAAIITDATGVLDKQQRARVEQRVLSGAATRTPTALRDQVDRAVIAADPEAAALRAEQARSGRGIWLDRARDDMAEFHAQLSCTDAQLAYGVLDEQATALGAAGLADGRGASQLRADIFCDLFHTLATTGHADLTIARPPADAPDHTAGANTGTVGDRAEDNRTRVGRASGVEPCRCPDAHTHPASRRTAGPLGSVVGRRRSTALNVYIDVTTLAGLDNEPGELAGYGTITADTARALAASADTIRALILRPLPTGGDGPAAAAPATRSETAGSPGRTAETDRPPDTGAAAGPSASGVPPRGIHATDSVRSRSCGTVLDAGRSVYRPTDAIIDYVTARDRVCTWPGCRAAARRCDADHRVPYGDGGATCACDVDLLCRFHHQVKTFTAWRAVPGRDGLLIWISPTGHRYPTEPGHPLLNDPPRDCVPQNSDPPPF